MLGCPKGENHHSLLTENSVAVRSDLAKDCVLALELVRSIKRDEELGRVSVALVVVRHADEASPRVPESLMGFVLEGLYSQTGEKRSKR